MSESESDIFNLNISTVVKYDSELNADSVEWCPHKPHQNFFVCANYQLITETQTRIGRILLFSLSPQLNLNLHQVLNTSGILDQKWCHQQINNVSMLGVVTANKRLEIYSFKNILQLVTFFELNVDDEVLMLSLDWSTGKFENNIEIICSDSKGCWHRFTFTENLLHLVDTFQAHSFQAWIAAFYYWDTNVFFTGGDDSLFLKFDKRCESKPVLKNRIHNAGVTSIHSNSQREFTIASGSYDENIYLWDLRNMRTPLDRVHMPGPVWRLKWDPATFNYLLAACMLGGAHILNLESDKKLNIVGSYYGHKSMTYGADWSHSNAENRIVATCSFYDNLLCVLKVQLN
ncbi:hypothetical protein FQA39_LY03675 [Lamprigera yunnana]|nr:hypothetical protein FQA39_LY03675 [Lamprigera yunnana]